MSTIFHFPNVCRDQGFSCGHAPNIRCFGFRIVLASAVFVIWTSRPEKNLAHFKSKWNCLLKVKHNCKQDAFKVMQDSELRLSGPYFELMTPLERHGKLTRCYNFLLEVNQSCLRDKIANTRNIRGKEKLNCIHHTVLCNGYLKFMKCFWWLNNYDEYCRVII